MDENELTFTEDIYSKHLTTIDGITFTCREIDIISCLLNARRTSQIASILSIAPRTVTTHFRNIMRKLDCSSQENIINFIEKSRRLSILRGYYAKLVIELTFEKSLKEISKLRLEEPPTCILIYWQNRKLKNALMQHLSHHLYQVGIHTEVREHVIGKKVEVSENINHTLLLLMEKNDQHEVSKDLLIFDSINLTEQNNYYASVTEILKKFFPNTNLESVLLPFRDLYVGMSDSVLDNIPKDYGKKESKENDNEFIHKSTLIFKNRKWHIASVFSIICLFSIGLVAIKSENEKSSFSIPFSNMRKEGKRESPLRSDFAIPTESALLPRPDLMALIDDKFKAQDGIQTVALVGIGGAGKTTLARLYARQQETKVIWEINGETRESLKLSFEHLAQALAKGKEDQTILQSLNEINDPIEKGKKLIQFVRERMMLHSNWFLIYDNVEKFADLQQYFPHDPTLWGTGKIIITTKDDHIQSNMHVNHMIQIGALDQSQKLNLFTKIMYHGDEHKLTAAQKEEIIKFLDKLPPFPLDISIAAYYLKATNIPYSKYLKHLDEHNKDFETTQENVLKEASDYTRTRYNIITFALKKLISEHKDFGTLLLFMSLLDSQNIPVDLFESYKSDVVVENFIYNLKKYSLITRESVSTLHHRTFSIHRSTQAISLDYLTKTLNLVKNKHYLEPIETAFENYIEEEIGKENHSKIKLLVKHCEMFLSHNKLLTHTMRGSIGGELGGAYLYLGEYIKAQHLLKESLENFKLSNSVFPLKITRALKYLGNVSRDLGDFEKAKEAFEKNLIIYKNYLPGNHRAISQTLGYLGRVYASLGQYKKAKELLEESLMTYKKHFPNDYLVIAFTLTNLGNVNKDLGNYKKAIEFLEQSLLVFKKYFFENPLKVAQVSTYLGNVYRDLGDYKKAEVIYDQSLTIYQKYLPEEAIDIGWSLIHLGTAYRDLGKFEEAKNLFEKSLVIYKKHFSEDHMGVAWVLFYLGKVYRDLGDYEKSKNLLEQSLRIFKRDLSETHVDLAWILAHLGNVNIDLGKYGEAKILLEKSLEIYKKFLPENHIWVTAASSYLGSAYSALGEYEKAKNCLEKVLILFEKHYGKDHVETARVLRSMGKTHLQEGNLELAEKLLDQALRIFQKNKHPEMYKALESLSELFLKKSTQAKDKGNLQASQAFQEKGIGHFKKALDIMKIHFPEDSPHIMRIQSKLKNIGK